MIILHANSILLLSNFLFISGIKSTQFRQLGDLDLVSFLRLSFSCVKGKGYHWKKIKLPNSEIYMGKKMYVCQ